MNFNCNNTGPHDELFMMEELTSALNTAKSATPGLDNIISTIMSNK